MEGPPYSCACVSRRRWTSTSPPRAPRTKETSWPVLEVAGTGIIVHTYACMCRRKYYLAFCIHTSCHRVQMSESLSRECVVLPSILCDLESIVTKAVYLYFTRLWSPRAPRPARPHRAQRSDDVRLEVLRKPLQRSRLPSPRCARARPALARSNVNFLGWNYENPRCNFSDERNGARITKQTGRLSRAARPGRVP